MLSMTLVACTHNFTNLCLEGGTNELDLTTKLKLFDRLLQSCQKNQNKMTPDKQTTSTQANKMTQSESTKHKTQKLYSPAEWFLQGSVQNLIFVHISWFPSLY